MRRFFCEVCGADVSFAALRCPSCSAELGYVPARRTVTVVRPTGGVSFAVAGDGTEYWRCLNAAWKCNWMLAAAAGDEWCRSCRLTRGRPDDGRPDAVEAWAVAEAAKRRLVYQLDQLGLPIEARSAAAPGGLAFDLVYLPGSH